MTFSRITRLSMLMVLAGGAYAAVAAAQSATAGSEPPKKTIAGSQDKPLKAQTRVRDAAGGTSTMSMTFIEDGQKYTVKIEGDDVSASINDEPVPQDRIERTPSAVIIKDKDGNVLKKIAIGFGHMGGDDRFRSFFINPEGGLGGRLLLDPWGQNDEGGGFIADANPPPVMAGITMAPVDGGLAEHLEIQPDEAFVIDRVYKEFPADKAGVKPFDVVVAIDGARPATQEKFREAMRAKKPGDKVELTILRRGAERRVNLELAAYDREKLESAAVSSPSSVRGMAPMASKDPLTLFGRGVGPDVRKQIEEAMRALGADSDKGEQSHKDAMRALEQALKGLQDGQAFTFRAQPGQPIPGGTWWGTTRDRAPGASNDGEVVKRMERLADQLERLDKRLDELEAKLKK